VGGEPSGAPSVLDEMRTSLVDVPARRLRHGGPDGATVHTAHWPASGEAPADAPVQICLHGLGGSHLNWCLLGPMLTDLGPVWAPDLAGFGLTPLDGRSSTVESNVDLAIGLIETVSDGRPVVLLGNSMGGHIAYTIAAKRPDLVGGLVLVGAAVPPNVGKPDPKVALRFALFAIPRVGEAYLGARARKLTPAEQVRETLELCVVDVDALDTGLHRAHVDLAARRRQMPDAHTAFITAARSLLRRIGPRRWHLWSQVDAISAPALILQGGRDRLVERIAADRLSERRPDWDYRVYEDHGHVIMIEVPERVSADIHAWRAEHLPLTSPAI
jgi:pimeloyl-ACP methyl ester carboxylesterase